MVIDVACEVLTLNISEAEKRKLRVVAACQGLTMTALVRGWIRSTPLPQFAGMGEGGDDADAN